jgi:hypothetical protein
MLQKQGVVGLAGALAEVEHWMSLATRDWPCEERQLLRIALVSILQDYPRAWIAPRRPLFLTSMPDVGQLSTGRNE